MQAWRIPEVITIKVALAPAAQKVEGEQSPPPHLEGEKKTFAVLETISLSSLRRALRREFRVSDVVVSALLPRGRSGTLESRILRRSRDLETAIMHWKTKRALTALLLLSTRVVALFRGLSFFFPYPGGPSNQYLHLVVMKKPSEKPAAPSLSDSASALPASCVARPIQSPYILIVFWAVEGLTVTFL